VEILVVGSDAPGLVAQAGPVRLIAMPLAHASDKRNRGMAEARGAIWLFLDDDCLPADDLLARHLARHAADEQVVGGAVSFADRPYLQLADNLSAFHDLLPSTPAGPRPYLCTANLSVRREAAERCGPMEPGRSRAEDLDWTQRLRMLGYRLYFDPTAIIDHRPARTALPAVWRHWVDDAPFTLAVRRRHAALLETPALASYRWPFLWLAPLIAAWATSRTYAHPYARKRYWHILPLVYLTKLAWCWGAFSRYPLVRQLADA
jgi:GT2 family glycosyltransferase